MGGLQVSPTPLFQLISTHIHPARALDTQPSRLPVPVGRNPGHCLLVTAPSAHHNTTQHNTPQQNTTQHSTAQHSTAQHSTAHHSTAHHSTAHHSTTQPSPAQHGTTTQHSTAQHNTTQHNKKTAQHSTAQHNTTQHNTTQHNTTQHNTTQHNTTQHNTTQHNTTQHNTTQQFRPWNPPNSGGRMRQSRSQQALCTPKTMVTRGSVWCPDASWTSQATLGLGLRAWAPGSTALSPSAAKLPGPPGPWQRAHSRAKTTGEMPEYVVHHLMVRSQICH